jgi:hypothetical protein
MKISMVAADACEAILLIAQGAIVRSVLSCIYILEVELVHIINN